jgi:hypothetical protein
MESRVVKSKKLEIYWFTISYKQILAWGGAIVLVGAFGGFALFRDYLVQKYNQFLEADSASRVVSTKKSGSFSKLIGTVKVKKSDAVQWVNADSQTVLEEGDYIQTSSDSFASIVFPDLSQYRMKPDSLIVVQENSEDPKTLAKKVSVRVTSGSINLSTGNQGIESSTNSVTAASATASLGSNTKMDVESNPGKKTARFALSQGTARVVSGKSSSSMGAYDQVTAEPDGKLTPEKLLRPPELLTPNSIKSVVAREGLATKIQFSWSPVPQATAYKIKISNSSVFSKNIREETLQQQTRYVTSGLGEGTYYWTVTAIGADSKLSRDSEPNKFTLINKSFREKETDVFLDVKISRFSNIFEIIGRTDPGASVVVNEEPVPLISADGSFKHFTSPLPHKGKNLITITAQDRSGNAKTLTKEVYVD